MAGERTRGRVVAVVLAAGGSTRMAGLDKIFAPLRGRPLIYYALALCEESAAVDAVVVVGAAGTEDKLRRTASAFGFGKIRAVVTGGAERRDSAAAGLAAAEALARADAAVLIHDAARPLASAEIIPRLLARLDAADGVIPAVPVADTVKVVEEGTGAVVETPPREKLWAVQTPQAFRLAAVAAAYRAAVAEGWAVTDDAAAVERAGGRVVAVAGDPENFKITYLEDLARAARVLEGRGGAA